jgi:hypothetical protein
MSPSGEWPGPSIYRPSKVLRVARPRRLSPPRALAAGLPAVLALATACGTPTAAHDIGQVVGDYQQALAQGDDAAACQDVAAATRQAIIAADRRAGGRVGCATALADVLRHNDVDASALLSSFAIGSITVNGDLATVPVSLLVNDRKLTEIVRVVREGGRWLVSDGVGL